MMNPKPLGLQRARAPSTALVQQQGGRMEKAKARECNRALRVTRGLDAEGE